MPVSIDHEGVLEIHFGTGDIVAAVGTWNQARDLAGLVLAQLPHPIEPHMEIDADPEYGEGQLGERPLVRLVFESQESIETMIEVLRETAKDL